MASAARTFGFGAPQYVRRAFLRRNNDARARMPLLNSSGMLMMVDANSISLGRCYVTANREVRKVLELDGQKLTYVARGKMAFPAWDQEVQRHTTKDTFARDVEREVPCDWHAP